jgi:hypothetical protein
MTVIDSMQGSINFSSLFNGKEKEKFQQFDIIKDVI